MMIHFTREELNNMKHLVETFEKSLDEYLEPDERLTIDKFKSMITELEQHAS